MKKLTLKFGGTSVGNIGKIKKVASIIKKRHSEGNQIIVVVSAMAGASTYSSTTVWLNLMVPDSRQLYMFVIISTPAVKSLSIGEPISV